MIVKEPFGEIALFYTKNKFSKKIICLQCQEMEGHFVQPFNVFSPHSWEKVRKGRWFMKAGRDTNGWWGSVMNEWMGWTEERMRSSIDNSRTGLDTSKNQCSAPAVTVLKNYWRYHVYNLFLLKNSSNVFAFIIIIIGCLTGNIIHDQLKLRPYFLPWVSKNRRYV